MLILFPYPARLAPYPGKGALSMLVNSQTLDLAVKGFKAVYTEANLAAPSHADKIAMTVPSSSRDETYGWLGQFPRLREWLGPRHVNSLKAHGFTIKNRKFEATVAIPRDDISDDRLGIYKPMFSEMGRDTRSHPDELIFDLLKSGFNELCFDGQSFFSDTHPVELTAGEPPTDFSNFQDGTGPAWYLLDTSRGVKPIIWQEREAYEFQSITDTNAKHVFMNDEYVYGVRARVIAGFGLWQLAFGTKADLTVQSYADARAAMMSFKSDGGRILGINPSVLVVPPTLEYAALSLLNAADAKSYELGSPVSNPYKGTAELIVSPYLT